jgi:hypothetical protein
MGASRTSFAKLQRDRAKKAKAAAKRERRQGGNVDMETGDGTLTEDVATEEAPELPEIQVGKEISAADLLVMVETLHKQFDNEEISFEEFEEKKIELMEQLTVD